MIKRVSALVMCVLMLLVSATFTAFAEDKAFSFEYMVGQSSTGDGYITVEYDAQKFTLEEADCIENIPAGAEVKVTIKAEVGSAITAVVYNGAPKFFGDASAELNMTIDNYSSNNSLKITYKTMYFDCKITTVGEGSAFFVTDEGKADVLSVPIGGGVEFEAVAQMGSQIESISVNGEEIDLEAYGKNETNKMEKFVNGISDISVNTEIVVVFSGGAGDSGNNGELLTGDANLDKKVNIQDATIIQKAVAGLVSFSDEQNAVADVDSDEKLTVKDATTIQKYTAGIITEFPASK